MRRRKRKMVVSAGQFPPKKRWPNWPALARQTLGILPQPLLFWSSRLRMRAALASTQAQRSCHVVSWHICHWHPIYIYILVVVFCELSGEATDFSCKISCRHDAISRLYLQNSFAHQAQDLDIAVFDDEIFDGVITCSCVDHLLQVTCLQCMRGS